MQRLSRESTRLVVITLRVPSPVRVRLVSKATDRGQPLAEYLRDELKTIAFGEHADLNAATDALVSVALEAIAKELSEFRVHEQTAGRLFLDRLEDLSIALASSIEALFKLSASDTTSCFTSTEAREFVDRVFERAP